MKLIVSHAFLQMCMRSLVLALLFPLNRFVVESFSIYML